LQFNKQLLENYFYDIRTSAHTAHPHCMAIVESSTYRTT